MVNMSKSENIACKLATVFIIATMVFSGFVGIFTLELPTARGADITLSSGGPYYINFTIIITRNRIKSNRRNL